MLTAARALPLAAAEAFRAEAVMGGFPLREAGTVAAYLEYGRERLLRGVDLLPRQPPWPARLRPARARRLGRWLAKRLGGWFQADLGAFTRFHPSSGADEYCALLFKVGPWQVHAVGVPGDFLCVFLGQALHTDRAVGAGGHPVRRPLGAVQEVLQAAAPALPPLEDRSGEHAENVFDSYLVAPGVIVRAGVRRRLTAELRVPPEEPRFFYGVRIDLGPQIPTPV